LRTRGFALDDDVVADRVVVEFLVRLGEGGVGVLVDGPHRFPVSGVGDLPERKHAGGVEEHFASDGGG
jgi:hypothetical protein